MNQVKKKINSRVIVLYIAVLLLSIAVFIKIIRVQHFNKTISTTSQPKYFNVKAPRGNIMADDGSLLAISMPLYDVRVDFSVIENTYFNKKYIELAHSLSNLFEDRSSVEYQDFLKTSKNRPSNKYILLKKKVTHTQLNALKKMPIFKLGQNRGGLVPVERPNRENPFGLLAKRTIGELRNVNPVGIERAYNQTLSGKDGRSLKRKIAKGIWVPQESEGNIFPKPGNNVITTINTDMQDVAEKALKNSLFKHDADWGCVVLMEVKTGEIKVITNLRKDTSDLISEWFNYALAEHSAPGSTFKLASIIAGLEDGFFKLTDTVNLFGGRIKYYDRLMRDSEHNYNKIPIHKAFVISSNVGISSIINENYKKDPQAYIDRIYQMGLSTPLNLELPYPNNLKMPTPFQGGWSGVTLPWMSTGYEMQLSPIHMLTFYNAVANNGKMIKPIFVNSITKDGLIIKNNYTEIINPAICSQTTIKKVIPLLTAVVNEGTAQNIKSKHYEIAGKTGTTVLNYNSRKSGEDKKYQASFVGFFPVEKPKYTCIVVVNNPKKNGFYGGSVAAPVFKELSDKIFALDMHLSNSLSKIKKIKSTPQVKYGNTLDANYVLEKLKIPTKKTSYEWMISQSRNNEIHLLARKIEKDLSSNIMPSLKGMNLMDAIFLLENYGLVVKTQGCGFVQSQSINKGDRFKNGDVIYLKLI
tara:strand:+ start:919 stop:3006 length:2088 start_codon:yes stop_codon:yes gene_type:complete